MNPMNASEPREDAVAGHVAVLEMYMRERCEHPEDEPAFRAAIAALAQQGAEPVAYLAENANEAYVFFANDHESLDAYTADGFSITSLVRGRTQAAESPATGAPR